MCVGFCATHYDLVPEWVFFMRNYIKHGNHINEGAGEKRSFVDSLEMGITSFY